MPLEIAQTNGIPVAIILVCFVSILFLKHGGLYSLKKNSESIINKAWITSLLIIIIAI